MRAKAAKLIDPVAAIGWSPICFSRASFPRGAAAHAGENMLQAPDTHALLPPIRIGPFPPNAMAGPRVPSAGRPRFLTLRLRRFPLRSLDRLKCRQAKASAHEAGSIACLGRPELTPRPQSIPFHTGLAVIWSFMVTTVLSARAAHTPCLSSHPGGEEGGACVWYALACVPCSGTRGNNWEPAVKNFSCFFSSSFELGLGAPLPSTEVMHQNS